MSINRIYVTSYFQRLTQYVCIQNAIQYELSESIPCTMKVHIISPRPAWLYWFTVYTLGHYKLYKRQSDGHCRSFLCSIEDNMTVDNLIIQLVSPFYALKLTTFPGVPMPFQVHGHCVHHQKRRYDMSSLLSLSIYLWF